MGFETLSTARSIIKYIEGLSHFIVRVSIKDVKPGEFYFSVEVPYWYKWTLGRILRRVIEKKLKERLILGVSFKFDIYSKTIF